MSDLKDLINERNLVSLNYNQKYLGNVLKEVLSIFKQHSIRISGLEAERSKYITKDTFDALNEHINQIKDEVREGLNFTKLKLDEYNNIIEDKFNSLKEWSENLHTNVLSDTKQMISDEMETISLKFATDEKNSLLEARIDTMDEKITKLVSELQEKADLDLCTITTSNLEMLDRRVGEVESNMAVVHKQLIDLPSMSHDLKDLVLEFPVVTKRIEKKVNDVINTVKSIKPITQAVELEKRNSTYDYQRFEPGKLDGTSKEVDSQLDAGKVGIVSSDMGGKPLNKSSSREGSSSRESDLDVGTKIDDPLKDFMAEGKREENIGKEEFGNMFANDYEPIRLTSQAKIDLLDDLIPETLHSPFDQFSQEQNTLSPMTHGYKDVNNPETTTYMVSSDSNQSGGTWVPLDKSASISTDSGQPVVHVVENLTYKTELKSPERIVSEIQWLKDTIKSHHEAIRKVQQGFRTQQDNIDNLIENVNKSHMNINTKITQAGQQIFSNKNDIDTTIHKLKEGIATLDQRITQIASGRMSDAQSEHNRCRIVRVRRKSFDPIEINDDPVDDTPSPDENDGTISRKEGRGDSMSQLHENMNHTPPNPEVNITQVDKPQPHVPPQPKMKGFVLFTSSFFANTKQKNERIMTSYIRDINDKPNCISKIPLGDIPPIVHKSTSSNLQSKNSKSFKSVQDQRSDPDQLKDAPAESKEVHPKRRFVIEAGVQMISKPTKLRDQVQQEVNVTISQEMIDEKVGKAAREVIADLTKSIHEKVQLQVEQMRKDVNSAISAVDQKIDREFVERLFNKFRLMLNEMNEKINNMQCSFLDWITRDELEMVLQKFMTMINENNQGTAATNSKFNCLLCGRPRAHLSGMIEGSSTQSQPPLQTLNHSATAKSVVRSSVKTAISQRRTSKKELENRGEKPPKDVVQLLAAD